MKRVGAGITYILLTAFSLIIGGACLKCFGNCTFFPIDDPDASSSCDVALHLAPCDGSCYGDHQPSGVTSFDKDYVHRHCSPQKFPDGCVTATEDYQEFFSKRCFCNTDACIN